ncbi:MAG: RNA methyltransferase [Bacteroidales bacterium]|nr:RNA methyltransferase [Bacteroidales bacterium]
MAHIISVTDTTHEGLDLFCRLTEAQLRNRLEPEKGIFIAESPKVIAAALDAGCQPVAMLTEQRHVEGQARALIERCGDIPVYAGSGDFLQTITGYELTRGVLCAMRRPVLRSIEDVCRDARRIVVLDNVVNATNTGAIFRAAAALGIDALLLSSTCSDPLNRRSVRVSMGTVFQLPWTYIDNWPLQGIADLHSLGFKVAAMALSDNSVAIDDERLMSEQRLAIVMGTEGDGLPASVLNLCDYVARIPMSRGVDSLNVAAAAAVAFWQLRATSSRY